MQIAHAARVGRAVVEDVAEVGVAVLGDDFRAVHAESAVGVLDDVVLGERLGEARPAGAAVELVQRAEKRLAGDDIDVDAGGVVVPVGVAEGRFGAGLAGDAVLLGGELLFEFFLGGFAVVVLVVCIGATLGRVRLGGGWGPGRGADKLRPSEDENDRSMREGGLSWVEGVKDYCFVGIAARCA